MSNNSDNNSNNSDNSLDVLNSLLENYNKCIDNVYTECLVDDLIVLEEYKRLCGVCKWNNNILNCIRHTELFASIK